jgi:hypothetical protein
MSSSEGLRVISHLSPFSLPVDSSYYPIRTSHRGETTDGSADTECVPKGGCNVGISLQYRRCSTHARTGRPSDHADEAPSRIWDNGCAGAPRRPFARVVSSDVNDLPDWSVERSGVEGSSRRQASSLMPYVRFAAAVLGKETISRPLL